MGAISEVGSEPSKDSVRKRRLLGRERERESSIQQRPDTRICVVQRISNGMKECEGDGCQRKSEAVEKECRTSGQTDMRDHRCLQI